ncbi:MAG TPA: heme exporter protein CcmD [Spongiibacteraceae bacterium]|jgi:heme exporter protein D
MQFDSLTALWQMGGHGPFVWSAYGIAMITLLTLIIVPIQRSRHLLTELRAGEARRSARMTNQQNVAAQFAPQSKEV